MHSSNNGAADTNNNSAQKGQNPEVEKTQEVKKKRTINQKPVYKVLRQARIRFEYQNTKDTKAKRESIENSLKPHYTDGLRFWMDFKTEVEQLLDSKKFWKYCDDINIPAEIVAEHVVFEGQAVKNKVHREGPQVLANLAYIFNEAIFIDKYNIFKKGLPPHVETESSPSVSSHKPVEVMVENKALQ